MLNLSKKSKKKKKLDVVEITFPTADEMLNKSIKSCPIVTPKEILDKMEMRASGGEREAVFYNSNISEKTYEDLVKKGYDVEIFDPILEIAGFKISW